MDYAVITNEDRRRLGSLLTDDDLPVDPRAATELDALLENAVYVEADQAPVNIVTLNAMVELVDVESGERRLLTLARPDEAEFFDDSVSVLEPLGMALLGSCVGDVIQCSEGRTLSKLRRIIH